MKRFLVLLVLLGMIFACGDEKPANEQRAAQAIPSAAGIAPTLPDPAMAGESLSPEDVPTADFTVSPGLSGTTSTVFTFDGSLTGGTIIKYKWKFGDGTYDKGLTVTHQYQYGGTYTVKLIAVSDTIERDKATKTLTVEGPAPPPDGGGGGGGGGGTVGTCQLNDFRTNRFTVISVAGTVITIDKNFKSCNACGEVRRNATGIMEFVGDLTDINTNRLTLDYASLPIQTRPQPGEVMYLVWKPLSERPNCTS